MSEAAQQRAAETRKRLEEAAQKKSEEERAASQKYKRTEYKTGKLTEEEKQKRLAEMMGNAKSHEELRGDRIRKAAEAEAVSDGKLVANEAGVGGRDGGDAFLKAASKAVYGAMSGEKGSLAARIGSRKHFHQG
eukprot:gene26049-11748_t